MTLYLGETLVIVADVLDDRGLPLDPPPDFVVSHFWAPGRNPRRDEPDAGPVGMNYRPESKEWVGDVSTAGPPWVPGVWTCRVTAAERFKNWEFFTFEIEP